MAAGQSLLSLGTGLLGKPRQTLRPEPAACPGMASTGDGVSALTAAGGAGGEEHVALPDPG